MSRPARVVLLGTASGSPTGRTRTGRGSLRPSSWATATTWWMPAATWSGSCALPASAATGPTPAARSTRCGPCSSPTCTPTNLIDLNNVLSAGIYKRPDLPIPVEHLAHPNRDPRPRMSPVRFQTDDRVHVSATLVQHAPMFGRHGRRACSGTVGAHTAVEQVAPIACAAGVGTLVLSYLVPGNWPEERWDRARGDFTGRFIVGKDLAVVDVGLVSP